MLSPSQSETVYEVTYPEPKLEATSTNLVSVEEGLHSYLEKKGSPLAVEAGFILQKKHWELIVGISAAESTFCLHQLGLNCWGITDVEGGYKTYATLQEGITDLDELITRWQDRGRWLTVDDMNGHYVVPENPQWVATVNKVLADMDGLMHNTSAIQ